MIEIIYRACDNEVVTPKKPQRPAYFCKKACFDNFVKHVLLPLRGECFLSIVFDTGKNNSRVLLDYMNKQLSAAYFNEVSIFDYGWANNKSSLLYAISVGELKELESPIYFLEDDYLHREDADLVILEGLEKFGLMTLYDHKDRYTRDDDWSYKAEEITLTESTHWRSAESTTCTWMLNPAKIDRGLIFGKALKYNLNDRALFRDLYECGYRLYTPIPGYSTHCHEPFMSPLIDWAKV